MSQYTSVTIDKQFYSLFSGNMMPTWVNEESTGSEGEFPLLMPELLPHDDLLEGTYEDEFPVKNFLNESNPVKNYFNEHIGDIEEDLKKIQETTERMNDEAADGKLTFSEEGIPSWFA